MDDCNDYGCLNSDVDNSDTDDEVEHLLGIFGREPVDETCLTLSTTNTEDTFIDEVSKISASQVFSQPTNNSQTRLSTLQQASKTEKLTSPNIPMLYGFKLKRLQIGTPELNDRIGSKQAFSVGQLAMKSVNQLETISKGILKSWCFYGIITSKSEVRVAKNASNYVIWTIGDLTSEKSGVKVMVFSEAYNSFWKENLGYLVMVFCPDMLPKQKDANQHTFAIRETWQAAVVGFCTDYGLCVATRKDGRPCTVAINKTQAKYCEFHVMSEMKKIKLAASQKATAASTQNHQKLGIRDQIRNQVGMIGSSSTVLGKQLGQYKGKGLVPQKTATNPKPSSKTNQVPKTGFLSGCTTTLPKNEPVVAVPVPNTCNTNSILSYSSGTKHALGSTLVPAKSSARGTLMQSAAINVKTMSTLAGGNKLNHQFQMVLNKIQPVTQSSAIQNSQLHCNYIRMGTPQANRILNPQLKIATKQNTPLETNNFSQKRGLHNESLENKENSGDQSSNKRLKSDVLASIFEAKKKSDQSKRNQDKALKYLQDKHEKFAQQQHKPTRVMIPKKSSVFEKVKVQVNINQPQKDNAWFQFNKVHQKTDVEQVLLQQHQAALRIGDPALGNEGKFKAMNVQKTNNLQHLQAAPSTTVKQGNSLFSNAKEFSIDKMKEILQTKSNYADDAHEKSDQHLLRKMDFLENKEKIAEKASEVKKIKAKALYCEQCKKYSEPGYVQQICKEESHHLVPKTCWKRFFECSNCKMRTTTLDGILPTQACVCGKNSWQRTSIFGKLRELDNRPSLITAMSEHSKLNDYIGLDLAHVC